MAKIKLAELAEKLEAELVPAGAELAVGLEVAGLGSLAQAGPEEVSFLHQAAHRVAAENSRAAALIVPRELRGLAAAFGKPLLVVGHSQLAVARALAIFHPPRHGPRGVHPTAILPPGIPLGAGVSIGPYAVVGEGSTIGDGVSIGAHVVIGRYCRLGDEVRLHPGVVLYDGVELGERVEVHSGSVIGADGFGYASVRGVHHKIPQVGKVVLEADVEVGACTTIDRAALDETRIGAGTKIDNQVQVGHNVKTGKGCILCGQVGIAGSTRLGDYVVLAGQVGVSGHLELGNGVQAGAAAIVLQSVAEGQVAGAPAVPIKEWRRQVAAQSRIAELLRRVKKLEKAHGGEEAQGES
jgi:UDP-3-O-[3-hydroxymyristoyl] glucosamine N-acyltransferase